jgi:hypothetical protein
MTEFFNPQEVTVRTKKVERNRVIGRGTDNERTIKQVYHVGNTNINFDTGDCVVFFYPPKEGRCSEHDTFQNKCRQCGEYRFGKIVFKKYISEEDEDDQS